MPFSPQPPDVVPLGGREARLLRESEERFRALVLASSEVVYRMSPDWKEMRQLRGHDFIPETETPTTDWLDTYIHPDDQPTVLAAIDAAIRTRSMFQLEHRVRRVDGSLGWTFSRAVPMLGADGQVVEWIGMASDVTERRRADEALRESEARQAFLLALSDRLLGQDDPLTIMRTAAEMLARHLGLARVRYFVVRDDDLIEVVAAYSDGRLPGPEEGHRLRLSEVPRSLGEPQRAGQQAFANDIVLEPDASPGAIAAWGGVRAASATPLVRDGRLVAILTSAHVEPRAWTELDRTLHREVAARTWDAVQRARAVAALVEANERLREVDARKNQFLAMLAHELRNPLAPMMNALYLLDRKPPGSESAARSRAVLDRQVHHLARLVDDLLDVTRIARGKIQLHPEPLDLREIVRATVEDFRDAVEKAGLVLELEEGPEPVPVQGDRTRLAQLLGNLIGNAQKFTPAGGRVTVSVALDAARNEAVLTVRDTGAGISAPMLSRLFEPFSQADDTLERSRGGLGLGLSLVKSIAELHGGTAAARSDGPTLGAELTVRLPLGTTAHAPARKRALSVSRQPRRVLIIEDNHDAAETLREVLDLLGHQVEVARTGPEGLERAQRFRPDAVLCDIGLPEKNGYEVAHRLRAMAEQHHVLLVALTGYAMPADRVRAREAGFDAHLVKPATPEAIESVLGAAPDGPASRRPVEP